MKIHLSIHNISVPFDVVNSREITKVSTAAVLREKGSNGDRELAYCLKVAGFDVQDVTVEDLLSERVSLSQIDFLAFPGGFSNSDVLGAGKGWAAGFIYHDALRKQIEEFYARPDTLSLGVCNGCQFMTALGLIDRENPSGISMNHNHSGKFESAFVSLKMLNSSSVMLEPLVGMELGVWVAHGEGRFSLDSKKSKFEIAAAYSSNEYPWNPNGSDSAAAAICSVDGRHLAIMPHVERSFVLWQWPYLPNGVSKNQYSPWINTFVAAKKWLESKK